jgi:integrase
MTSKEKIRTGKVIEVVPAGYHDKKKIQTEVVYPHMLDGSVRASVIPLLNPEEVDEVFRKEVVEQVFKDVRKSKKTKKSKVRKYPERRVKGTSDFIPYDIALKTGLDLLWSGANPEIGFYIVMQINTGLRTGDIQTIKYSDLMNKKVGDILVVIEQKTGKERKIKINDKILDAFRYMYSYHVKRNKGTFKDGYIFLSRKGTTFRTISLNRILKEVFKGIVPTVSTHSLRKSFGRHVYDMNHQSEHSLIILSKIFSHTNMQDTRRYLGLSDEEIGDIYLNL